jgi:chromosome transmission fidelity protein 4
VRVWHTDQGADQEPEMATEADQGITSLSAAVREPINSVCLCIDNLVLQYDCWLSGSEDSVVRRYDKHKPDLLGHVASANAVPIHSVSVNPEGNRVAVASEYVNVSSLVAISFTPGSQRAICQGHRSEGYSKVDCPERAQARSTTDDMASFWNLTGTPSCSVICCLAQTSFKTTCGSDGKLIIWDISEEEGKEEKVIEGILPSILNTQCVVLFSPELPPHISPDPPNFRTIVRPSGIPLDNTSSSPHAHMVVISFSLLSDHSFPLVQK